VKLLGYNPTKTLAPLWRRGEKIELSIFLEKLLLPAEQCMAKDISRINTCPLAPLDYNFWNAIPKHFDPIVEKGW
jgi:hypothetical protein